MKSAKKKVDKTKIQRDNVKKGFVDKLEAQKMKQDGRSKDIWKSHKHKYEYKVAEK